MSVEMVYTTTFKKQRYWAYGRFLSKRGNNYYKHLTFPYERFKSNRYFTRLITSYKIHYRRQTLKKGTL